MGARGPTPAGESIRPLATHQSISPSLHISDVLATWLTSWTRFWTRLDSTRKRNLAPGWRWGEHGEELSRGAIVLPLGSRHLPARW
ncbi:hypothetical protein IAQ61_009531 [Plenodomus lingam]|uniref:uncharacterized protein n=1 Tax=Leptosphaeria maculans TaxID=5022 RepID=UPI00331E9863|nr:hypothetical protein IAQ61_009531 [Plenodomus lingam]